MSKIFWTTVLGLVTLAQADSVNQQCPSTNVCYSINIPDSSASASTGIVNLQISAPSSYSWIGMGTGSSMSGSTMFIVYADSATNITLSPRDGTGHSQPAYASDVKATLLDGTGISNGIMTANIRCSNCPTSQSAWIFAGRQGSALDSSSESVSIQQHTSTYGSFSFDLSKATGGASANPFAGTTNSNVVTSSDSTTSSSKRICPVSKGKDPNAINNSGAGAGSGTSSGSGGGSLAAGSAGVGFGLAVPFPTGSWPTGTWPTGSWPSSWPTDWPTNWPAGSPPWGNGLPPWGNGPPPWGNGPPPWASNGAIGNGGFGGSGWFGNPNSGSWSGSGWLPKEKRAAENDDGCQGNSSSSGSGRNQGPASSESNLGVFFITENKAMAHGVIACLSFGFLFPVGGVIMRVLHIPGLLWIHGGFQLFTALLFTIAFGLGINLANELEYLNQPHSVIGIILWIAIVIQPFLGIGHHNNYKKTKCRSAISYAHIWVGRIAITLGIINGGLGFYLAGYDGPGVLAYGLLAGIVWLVYVFTLAFTKRNRKPKTPPVAQRYSTVPPPGPPPPVPTVSEKQQTEEYYLEKR